MVVFPTALKTNMRKSKWKSIPSSPSSPMIQGRTSKNTLQATNISPKNGILKMIFLFPRWDMLIPWRVCETHHLDHYSLGCCLTSFLPKFWTLPRFQPKAYDAKLERELSLEAPFQVGFPNKPMGFPTSQMISTWGVKWGVPPFKDTPIY